jgi:hypothetical protein
MHLVNLTSDDFAIREVLGLEPIPDESDLFTGNQLICPSLQPLAFEHGKYLNHARCVQIEGVKQELLMSRDFKKT